MKKLMISMAVISALGVSSPAFSNLIISGTNTGSPEPSSSVAQGPVVTPSKTNIFDGHYWVKNDRIVVKEFGSGKMIKYDGFGKDISLSDSLKLIVPVGWKVSVADGVNANGKVYWRSKGSWTKALFAALSGTSYSARVFWSRHRIEIDNVASQEYSPDKSGAAAAKVAVAASHKDDEVKKAAVAAPIIVPKKPMPAPEPKWVILAGKPISQSVSQWADKAGWQVVWNGMHWAPNATSVFDGDFKTAFSAMINAANAQGYPVHAAFFSNRIVVVTGGEKGSTGDNQ